MSRLLLSAAGAALALAALPHVAAAQTAPPNEAMCDALARPGTFTNTVVASAKVVPAAGRVPAHCEVIATVSPVTGSRIGVVYRLPEGWNGKLLGYGGGGWAGNTSIATAAQDLARGYATLQTDAGHPSLDAQDTGWVAPGGKTDVTALDDFSWRGVHAMTEAGKQVVARYYGRPQQLAYFLGCSTGGRMALMEAQRFPGDYDAIVAGAPVYSLRTQLAGIYRDWIWTQPGAAITPAHLALIHDAVLAACDGVDGVKDGIVTDARACRFDPAALQCKPGQAAAQCLTAPQVAAVRREYETVRGKDGDPYVFGFSRGSEPGWTAMNLAADPARAAQGRSLGLRMPMFGDANFSFASFDVMGDSPRVLSSAFSKAYDANDADLRPFLKKGGKLILWHGEDDPLPSPWGTVDYYGRMQKAVGPAAQAGVRFFMAPGVQHCGGGPGANSFDMVAALDDWVKSGTAPERIVGVHVAASRSGAPAGPQMSRPICAWPAQPRYDGKGDANAAASFTCK